MKNSHFRTIFLWVLIVHVSLALIQRQTKNKAPKKKMIVSTRMLPPTKTVKRITQKKAKTQQTSPKAKKPSTAPQKYAKVLTESLEKCLSHDFSSNFEAKGKTLSVPKVAISIQRNTNQTPIVDEKWEQKVVDFLKMHLVLPEQGEVGLRITIDKSGTVQKIGIFQSKNEKNLSYLKNTLPHLKFPCNNQEAEVTFEFLFRNESF